MPSEVNSIIEYKIASAVIASELERKVNEMIMEGYVPLGGVSYFKLPERGVVPYEFMLAQALVKYENLAQ